jgi:hypothetical protein
LLKRRHKNNKEDKAFLLVELQIENYFYAYLLNMETNDYVFTTY